MSAVGRAARAVVSSLAYPSILIGALAVAVALLQGGSPLELVATGVPLAVLASVALLERLVPHMPDWNTARGDVGEDLAYLALAAVTQPLMRVGAEGFAVVSTLFLAGWLGPQPWPPGWPVWTQVLLALVVADLGKYWLHRIAHERAWLWRFHAAHHSPGRMYSLNGVRLHPVNLAWNLGLDVGVPLLLGLDGAAIVLVGVFRTTVSLLQHANVEMRLGPLNWLLSTPTLHQWHHSDTLAEGNTNYGSTFILWDVLFGTRFLPSERRAPERIGLAAGATHPEGLPEQILWPFCQERLASCPAGRLVRSMRSLLSS